MNTENKNYEKNGYLSGEKIFTRKAAWVILIIGFIVGFLLGVML